MVSIEALARWTHPQRGAVAPDQFIALAEQIGLITPLTRLVLSKAADAGSGWQGPGVRVAVNFSASVLRTAEAVAMVNETLVRTGLAPGQLLLEITESALAEDTPAVAQALQSLRALGARLAIDDLGTGYSAMSYLKRLPVEELKTDRSFAARSPLMRGDLSIVPSLVRLAQSPDLRR